MKIPNIHILGLGVVLLGWLGLTPKPAFGFTLDLFSDTEANTVDFLFRGEIEAGEPIEGQQVRLNQNPDPNNSRARGEIYLEEDSDRNLNTSNVVGGNRHIKISTTSGTGATSLLVGTDVSGQETNNLLTLDTTVGTTSVGTVVWNGSPDIDFTDLNLDAALNANLIQFGDDSIGINIISSDQTGDLKLTLYSAENGGNTHTVTQTLPIVSENDDPETLYYSFDTYTNNNVDITSVDYIALEIAGGSSSDIQLDFLETAVQPIPFEFSPALGLIISGAFFGFHIYRQKQKSDTNREELQATES